MSKILIVEDEEYISSMYKLKFEQSKYEVFIAPDGRTGLDLAHQKHPDIILLDLVLPGENGYSILQKMRKDPELKKTPVVITSNLGQDHEVQQGLDMGATDYIVKTSVTPQELVVRIDKLLHKD